MPSNRNGDVCMQIIPTTGLQTDFRKMEKRVKEVMEFSRWIQIDVSDTKFTSGKTFELELLKKTDLNIDSLLWDIHLMVNNPESWMEKCMFVGASRIIGQVEMMYDREKFVKRIKDEGLEVGLAFDVETDVDNIPEETDVVLLMGRKAGFGYFDFEMKVLEKIKKAKKMGFRVGVDGGVNLENIELIREAGADIVYSEVNYWDLKDVG